MNTKQYYVICDSLSGIETLVDELITLNKTPENLENTTLRRSVIVDDYLHLSDTTSILSLTEEEVEFLSYDPRVVSISEVKERSFDHCALPALQKQSLNTAGLINSSSNNPYYDNWGLSFCSTITAVSGDEFSYYYTGSGVNVVIIDSGVTDGHPEWISRTTGLSRLKKIDWTLFYPATSTNTVNVSVGPKTGGGVAFYFNGSERPIWYVPSDTYASSGNIYNILRTTIYNFNLDGTTTAGYPFYIGPSEGLPNNTIVDNNGATTGTVTLTVFPITSPNYFSGNMVYFSSFTSGMGNLISKTKYNTQTSNYYRDTNGHGTHCTGIAAGSAFGWAKEADIYSIKIFQDSGSNPSSYYSTTECFDLAKLLFQNSGKPTVTNNSWGYTRFAVNYNSQQSDVDAAVKTATDAGVHVIISAGNDGSVLLTPTLSTFVQNGDTVFNINDAGTPNMIKSSSSSVVDYFFRHTSPQYPLASYGPNDSLNPVIKVGALGYRGGPINSYKMLADYTARGPGVDIYAPGSNIQSAYNTTSSAIYRDNPSYGVIKLSGTSMAGPQVVGILATYLQANPTATPLQAKQFLLKNAFKNGIYFDKNYSSFYPVVDIENKFAIQYPPKSLIYSESSNCLKYNDICYSNTGSTSFTFSNSSNMLPASALGISDCNTCTNNF